MLDLHGCDSGAQDSMPGHSLADVGEPGGMAAGLSEGHQLSGQAFLEAAFLSLLISQHRRVAVPVPVSSDHNSN
jgi:hypothetical protein